VGELIPNTVTKHLHVDKAYLDGIDSFEIRAMNGYSDLPVQVRTLVSFHRPAILADDLLHKGFRLEKLDRILREEGLEIQSVMVGILSGRGRDLMEQKQREVRAAYYVPNLLYWFNESLLYPFIGGDSSTERPGADGLLPTANLILPYYYPDYLAGAEEEKLYALSLCALENARDILSAMERLHQAAFGTPLSIRRLAEAFLVPRIPDRSGDLRYRPDALPSSCVRMSFAAMEARPRRPAAFRRGARLKPMEEALSLAGSMADSRSMAAMPGLGLRAICSSPRRTR
jgi:hypothetical protein